MYICTAEGASETNFQYKKSRLISAADKGF